MEYSKCKDVSQKEIWLIRIRKKAKGGRNVWSKVGNSKREVREKGWILSDLVDHDSRSRFYCKCTKKNRKTLEDSKTDNEIYVNKRSPQLLGGK